MSRNSNCCDCDVIHHDAVHKARREMPVEEMVRSVADFYKMMGDHTRCRILFALSIQEMCVCDLANLLSMTKSSISHQLSKLRASGLVRCRRQGKGVYYTLDDDHVAEILHTTMVHIDHKHEEVHNENG